MCNKLLEVALNIDKTEYIEEFIELRYFWKNEVSKVLKDFYINIISKQTVLPNEFVEVIKFLEDTYKAKLVSKLDLNTKQIFEILKYIRDEEIKSKFLANIAIKFAKNKDITKTIALLTSINDNFYLYQVLEKIVDFIEDIEWLLLVLDIIEIKDYECATKAYVIQKIIDKKANKTILFKVLEVIDTIEEIEYYIEVLKYIIRKSRNKQILLKVLEIIENIKDKYEQVKLLAIIGEKFSDKNILEKAYQLAYHLQEYEAYVFFGRERAELLSLISEKYLKIGEIDTAIQIAKEIENDFYQAYAFVTINILLKNEDIFQNVNQTADLDMIRLLSDIGLKFQKSEVLLKALELINNISSKVEKKLKLELILKNTTNYKVLNRGLDIFKDLLLLSQVFLFEHFFHNIKSKKLMKKAIDTIISVDCNSCAEYILGEEIISDLIDEESLSRLVTYVKSNVLKLKIYAYESLNPNNFNKEMLFAVINTLGILSENRYSSIEILNYIANKTTDKELLSEIVKVLSKFEEQ